MDGNVENWSSKIWTIPEYLTFQIWWNELADSFSLEYSSVLSIIDWWLNLVFCYRKLFICLIIANDNVGNVHFRWANVPICFFVSCSLFVTSICIKTNWTIFSDWHTSTRQVCAQVQYLNSKQKLICSNLSANKKTNGCCFLSCFFPDDTMIMALFNWQLCVMNIHWWNMGRKNCNQFYCCSEFIRNLIYFCNSMCWWAVFDHFSGITTSLWEILIYLLSQNINWRFDLFFVTPELFFFVQLHLRCVHV